MNTGTSGSPHRSLGQLIRERREVIVQLWESRVRSLIVPGMPGSLLRDDMPEVIETVALLADAGRPETPPEGDPSEQHAVQRLGVGFELAHVLMEYSILRNCILDVVAQNLQLTVDIVRTLNDAVDRVANRSIERFTRASERLLKALDLVVAEVFQSKRVDDLLHRLLKIIMQTSPAVHSAAVLLNDNGVLRVRAAEGLIAERSPDFSLNVGEGFSGTIAAERAPRLSHDAAQDPLVKSDFIKLRGIRALYGVPLVDVGVVGVAHIGSLTAHDFTGEEKLLFQAIATRATAAIVQAQLLERLEAEHRLVVSTVEQMPIGVVIRGASGDFIIANEAATTMLRNEAPWSSPAGSVSWRMLDREGNELPKDHWPTQRALGGNEAGPEEITLVWPDGLRRTFSASATPVRDDLGRILASVLVFEDITAEKQIEEERQFFISTMSHDLRSPLSVIRFAAETLSMQSGTGKENHRTLVQKIDSNAHRMERLIEQLLEFARSRHGGIPVEPRSVDLVSLSQQMIASLGTVDAGRIVLRAPGKVLGSWDPDRVLQLLQNLLGNALEHGGRQKPVDVTISEADPIVELRVFNATEGRLPPDLVAHLFEPFRRGPGARSGLGLGLYICQQIVRAHGGTIEASADDEGITFIVRLPRHAPPRPEPA